MHQNKDHEGTYLTVLENLKKPFDPGPEITPVMADALSMATMMMEIIKDYNIRHISPRNLVELSSRLHEAGVIGLAEYAALSFQPELYAEYHPDEETYQLMQADPERPRDFIVEWEGQLKIVQQHPDPFNLKLTTNILELLQCFEPMEDNNEI